MRSIRQVIEKLKFNDALKSVLDQLVTDLIETTSARVREAGVKTVDDVRRHVEADRRIQSGDWRSEMRS